MPISVRWLGSEQGGIRPVLIVQNNVGNRYSPTVIAAAITSQINKAKMPTHITVGAPNYGLTKGFHHPDRADPHAGQTPSARENGARSTKSHAARR